MQTLCNSTVLRNTTLLKSCRELNFKNIDHEKCINCRPISLLIMFHKMSHKITELQSFWNVQDMSQKYWKCAKYGITGNLFQRIKTKELSLSYHDYSIARSDIQCAVSKCILTFRWKMIHFIMNS